MSDEVEEGEYKDPNEVDKVPVQSGFLHHLVVAAALKHPVQRHQENDDVDDHAGEDVESVESCNEEEEVRVRLLNGVLAVFEVRAEREHVAAGVPKLDSLVTRDVAFVLDVLVQREAVQLRAVFVVSILRQGDVTLFLGQHRVGIAFAPRLCQVAKVMVHVDHVTFVQGERVAVVGCHHNLLGQLKTAAGPVNEVRPFPSL